ncbi:MAG: dTDP-4-dehydrorhamnose reductase [Elusimicrobiales bacterium]|jgi:dTDP-4-dehydrorhamnose reductase
MRALLTGSKGQLGLAFAEYFERNGWDYKAADLDILDITDPDAVMDAVTAYRPGLIVNCAAYNLVDKAETDGEKAFAVNAFGPRNLASAARRLEAFFVHFSTDYVFDGAKTVPYTERDKPNPLNVYGRSKLKGEEYASLPVNSLVLRLSWVYGRGEQNFIHKLKGWAAGPGPLRVSFDEISVPTYTEDVVSGVAAALKRGLTGVRHLTNSGYCSRYDWAKLALKELGIDKKIEQASLAEFKLPARRPAFSAMSNAAISKEFGIEIPAWQDSVRKFIKESK